MQYEDPINYLLKGVDEWNSWKQNKDQFNINFSGSNLSGLDFSGYDLSYCRLANVKFRNCEFHNTNFHRSDLTWAEFENSPLNNVNLESCILHATDFLGAKLSSSNLSYSMGFGVNLGHADLSNSNIEGVNWHGGLLSGANLSNSNLKYANLQGADLDEANLSHTNLFDTNMSEANLRGTNFSHCALGRTNFGLTNIKDCIGLESVQVVEPCSIDYRSVIDLDTIPITFLAKLGISKEFIQVLGNTNEQANDTNHIYLKYSEKDQIFAFKLYEALITLGVRVWLMRMPSRRVYRRVIVDINKEISLLICSEQSLREEWLAKGSRTIAIDADGILRSPKFNTEIKKKMNALPKVYFKDTTDQQDFDERIDDLLELIRNFK